MKNILLIFTLSLATTSVAMAKAVITALTLTDNIGTCDQAIAATEAHKINVDKVAQYKKLLNGMQPKSAGHAQVSAYYESSLLLETLSKRQIAKIEQKLMAVATIEESGEQFPPFSFYGLHFCYAMKKTNNNAPEAVIELLGKKNY